MVCWIGDGTGGPGVSIWDGIQAAFGKRMAAGEAPQRQPGTANRAETDHRDIGVLRAGGQIKTLRWAEGMKHRRHSRLIDPKSNTNREGGFVVDHDRKDLKAAEKV